MVKRDSAPRRCPLLDRPVHPRPGRQPGVLRPSSSAGRPRKRAPSTAATSTSPRTAGRGRRHAERRCGRPPDGWSVYLATDDAKATADSAAKAATSSSPPMDVADARHHGRGLIDPAGPPSAPGSPGPHTGFGVWAEDGTPAWFELHTRDYDEAVAVLQATSSAGTPRRERRDDFRYTTLGEGENQLAGIMDASAFLPDGVPSHWTVYFGVSAPTPPSPGPSRGAPPWSAAHGHPLRPPGQPHRPHRRPVQAGVHHLSAYTVRPTAAPGDLVGALRVPAGPRTSTPARSPTRQRATWDRMLATDGLTEGFGLYLDPAG